MTRGVARAIRLARSTALNVGAALGLLVLVAVVAGAVFGVRPVVITSGSMEPTVSTGALVITRTVPAADLEVGDVVTVPTTTGSRVTHRIVALDEAGSGVILTLRGDANPVPDAEPYPVSSADRMVVDVPLVGYVLSAMRSPAGLVVGGALTAALLLFLFSGGHDRGGGSGGPAGRHRGARRAKSAASAGAGVVSTLSLAALLAVPSAAAWTDPADISGTAITAHAVAPPVSASCSSALLVATVSWPGDARYDYEVVLRRVSNSSVVSTRQVTGAETSVTYSGLADFGLVVGAGTVDFQVEIRSYLASTTSWRSASVQTYTYVRVFAIVIGATATCTT